MQIPLKQFEHFISETILTRGLSYFKKGYVREPEEMSSDKYEAIVEGTNDYRVQYTLQKDVITEFVCNCPYDMGPVCKHVAAVIFYLQQDELGLNTPTKKSKNEIKEKKPRATKRKTIAEQVNELLDKATHEELKEFLRETISANSSFRNLFLASFAQHNSNESKELYAKQINSILNALSGRHRFIDWSASSAVGIAVSSIYDTAQKQFDKGNYQSTVYICTAIMEQMTEAMQYSDDSSGDISSCISLAYDLLKTVAETQRSEDLRKQIIDYCFMAYDKQIYSGWDWHIGVLEIIAILLKTEEEKERVFEFISMVQPSDYEREHVERIKYEILLKTEEDEVVDLYIEQNITNSILRREAIKKAMQRRNYEKAKSVALDGVSYNLKDKPGLVTEWYDWLLKIAQAENDTDKKIEYSRYLFIDNFSSEQDYLKILKQNVLPEKWVEFVEEIIQDISSKDRWTNTDLIAKIFISEQWWDRLLEIVKSSPDFSTISRYEEYLSTDYANEIAGLYADAILEYLRLYMSRDHYQNACRYIRRIIKLGAREKANNVISILRTKYSRRSALMEELNKV